MWSVVWYMEAYLSRQYRLTRQTWGLSIQGSPENLWGTKHTAL